MRLDAVKDFKVLFVGDAIVDEYRYVEPIGKSVKDNILSTKYKGENEVFYGGVWAAANHARDFCSLVHTWRGPEVIENLRYVESIYNRKLITIHQFRALLEDEGTIGGKIFSGESIEYYDLVVVTDYGHGTMTKSLINKVCKEAKFLAVNTQTNSTNYGFNLITRYPRADYIVLDELEARLAVHDRDSDIEDVILKLGYKRICVTQGAHGAVGFDGEFYREKAIARSVVDTMGAGDAFLAVSAPFAAAGASMKEIVQIGNAAGAIKVGIIGHRKAVTKAELEAYLGVK